MRYPAVLLVLALAPGPRLSAAQAQFFRVEGARTFLEGALQDVSVDSLGRLTLAPAVRLRHSSDMPYVWCLARDAAGRIYAGTGNDGKVLRLEGERADVFFDAEELEVHALAAGPDGRLYVGSSPDGKVYAVDPGGQARTFFDPEDKYIWALAFDSEGQLWVGTGTDGRIHRVDRQGKAVTVFTSPETHITSLLVTGGATWAGSSPGGLVYRIEQGRVSVVHDSAYREVKALAPAPGGVWAAVIDGRDRDQARPSPAPTPPPVGAPTAEVTVTESFAVVAPGGAQAIPLPLAPPAPPPGPGGRSAVLRVSASGDAEALFATSDDTPYALAASAEGVVVGTGRRGQVYLVRPDRTWSMLASLPAQQVTALVLDGKSFVAGTANPGRVHEVDGPSAATGTYTSRVLDAETEARWGEARWEASLPPGCSIEVLTRSGQTASPDATWSAWSPPLRRAQGEPISSPPGRYLQLRAVLSGRGQATPRLESVSLAYLPRNARPQIVSLTVHPPGEAYQKPLSTADNEILGLDQPPASGVRPAAEGARPGSLPPSALSRKVTQRGIQTFTWRAEDANDDDLAYDLHYRRLGDAEFRPLRAGLTEPVFAWDTTTVPDGRYVIRLTVDDRPSNPGSPGLTSEETSTPFDVDNSPPSLTVAVRPGPPRRVVVTAREEGSLIRRAEWSLGGAPWKEALAQDGLSDSFEETYEIDPGALDRPGPHLLAVRVTDALGNAGTARVEIP